MDGHTSPNMASDPPWLPASLASHGRRFFLDPRDFPRLPAPLASHGFPRHFGLSLIAVLLDPPWLPMAFRVIGLCGPVAYRVFGLCGSVFVLGSAVAFRKWLPASVAGFSGPVFFPWIRRGFPWLPTYGFPRQWPWRPRFSSLDPLLISNPQTLTERHVIFNDRW